VIGRFQGYLAGEHKYGEDTDIDYAHTPSGFRAVDDNVPQVLRGALYSLLHLRACIVSRLLKLFLTNMPKTVPHHFTAFHLPADTLSDTAVHNNQHKECIGQSLKAPGR
jgi:hypothetical protein